MSEAHQLSDLIKIDVQSIFLNSDNGESRNRHARRPSASRIRAIRLTGMVKPVVVQGGLENGRFRLLQGRVRWQAAVDAQLPRIPAIECKHPDLDGSLKRLDRLVGQSGRNPIHLAEALRDVQTCIPGCTRSDLADLCSWPVNSIVHHLQLLELPEAIRRLLELERLSFGHGKVLTGRKLRGEPERLKAITVQAIKEKWSVRDLENAIKGTRSASPSIQAKATATASVELVADPNIKRLADRLTDATGLPTAIEHRPDGKGRVVFSYHSLDEMDNLLRFFPTE